LTIVNISDTDNMALVETGWKQGTPKLIAETLLLYWHFLTFEGYLPIVQ